MKRKQTPFFLKGLVWPLALLTLLGFIPLEASAASMSQASHCPAMGGVRYYDGIFKANTVSGNKNIHWQSLQVFPEELLVVSSFQQAKLTDCQQGSCQVVCTYNIEGNREVSLSLIKNQFYTKAKKRNAWAQNSCSAALAKSCVFQLASVD